MSPVGLCEQNNLPFARHAEYEFRSWSGDDCNLLAKFLYTGLDRDSCKDRRVNSVYFRDSSLHTQIAITWPRLGV